MRAARIAALIGCEIERHDVGLVQLAKCERLNRGYLFVFDQRENAEQDYSFSEHIVAGKKIQV